MLTVSSGLGFYNHAVILKALTSNLDFPITASSIAISIFFLSGGLAGLVVSLLLERCDARIVITSGALIAGVSLGSLGLVENLTQLFVLYVLFGIGFSASGLLPVTTLITRWFVHRRAAAMSIATTGLSVGGVLVTPLSAYLIEQQGIRLTAPWLGVLFVLGIVPVCLIYVRSNPPAAVDSSVEPESSGVETALPGLPGRSFKEATRSRYFWGLSVAYFCLMLSQVGGIAHQFNLLAGHISIGQATTMLAILPASSIVGRLAGGWILGHTDMKAFTLLMIMVQVLSMLVLSGLHSQWALGLGLMLFGISVGNVLMLHPLLVAESFGLKHYSRIFALSNLMATMGVAVGPGLMGWLYSLNGNYTNAYLMATLVSFVAFLILWFVQER
jgi:MFS family permease